MAGAMKFNLTCPRCGGTGRLKNACPTCRGEGAYREPDTVEVRIPPGVANGIAAARGGQGQCRHAGGAGRRSVHHGPRRRASVLQARRRQYQIQVPLTVSEAGLGAKIEVPTIDGRALLKIPQGTQNGQKFRLREKGVFNARKNTRGDQIVEVVLQAPDVQRRADARAAARAGAGADRGSAGGNLGRRSGSIERRK